MDNNDDLTNAKKPFLVFLPIEVKTDFLERFEEVSRAISNDDDDHDDGDDILI